MLVLMAGIELPVKAIRQQICSAVDVIVQARRIADGTRKTMKITEVIGMEGDTVLTQDIFEFVQTGVNANGIVEGHFRATGVRPSFMDRLNAAGIVLEGVDFGAREGQ
jgi:pilus assembly protein CpaF